MIVKDLTASERFLLREIDSVPDKIVRKLILRQVARHMTDAGFNRVLDKMCRRSLVAYGAGGTVTITYSGQRSIEGKGA